MLHKKVSPEGNQMRPYEGHAIVHQDLLYVGIAARRALTPLARVTCHLASPSREHKSSRDTIQSDARMWPV